MLHDRRTVGGRPDRVPVRSIVDSPWLPGYAGIETLDYFLQPDLWWRVKPRPADPFPRRGLDSGLLDGVRDGRGTLGVRRRIIWHHSSPPSIEPLPGGLEALAAMAAADPDEHGLMPLVLQRYRVAQRRLKAEGAAIRMVAARGRTRWRAGCSASPSSWWR